jgi:hypothetical protein
MALPSRNRGYRRWKVQIDRLSIGRSLKGGERAYIGRLGKVRSPPLTGAKPNTPTQTRSSI